MRRSPPHTAQEIIVVLELDAMVPICKALDPRVPIVRLIRSR
jgi:hypothetical protein